MGTGTGTIIIGLLFIVISAIAKSVMDKLQFHYDRSVFSKFKNQQFWNPELSWKNKWKNGDNTQGEKFLGSSTIFVFITDAWHLFQSIFLNFLFLGLFLVINNYTLLTVLLIISARILFGLVFTHTFHKRLNKKV